MISLKGERRISNSWSTESYSFKGSGMEKNKSKRLNIEKCYDLIKAVGVAQEFVAEKVSQQLNISLVYTYKILKNMEEMNCISHEHGKYELEYVGEKLDGFMH